MALFSVVISVYNKAGHIENTLKSVLAQTVQNFEIIVVNDGSTDSSLDCINAFEDPRIIVYTTTNKGAGAARNFGITKATSPYIALLDGDDYWHPHYLEDICKLQALFPKARVFATAIALKTQNFTYPAPYSIPNQAHQIVNYFEGSTQHTLLSSSSVVIANEVFERVGLFDETIVSGQDTDLWIRIGLHYSIAFSKRVAVTYIDVPKSLSNRTTNVNLKCKFDKFQEAEKDNKALKKVLDLNRYSMAILSKVHNDTANFNYFKEALDTRNLNWKQRVTLNLNQVTLRKLIQLKAFLKRKKIILSVFK